MLPKDADSVKSLLMRALLEGSHSSNYNALQASYNWLSQNCPLWRDGRIADKYRVSHSNVADALLARLNRIIELTERKDASSP